MKNKPLSKTREVKEGKRISFKIFEGTTSSIIAESGHESRTCVRYKINKRQLLPQTNKRFILLLAEY